jgi:hypothetical protein
MTYGGGWVTKGAGAGQTRGSTLSLPRQVSPSPNRPELWLFELG